MSLAEVIGCAPFRLASARSLTSYEWTVVRTALENGYAQAGLPVANANVQAEVSALQHLLEIQAGCPAWRMSAFGPAPAVAPYAYQCLAAWYGGLDPASKARAAADIGTGQLLCAQNPPWAACPTAQARIGQGARDLWEGAAQLGDLRAASESCAWPRQRTSYMPMKGQEMLELFKTVGGQAPPELAQAVALGNTFLQRDFLVGIQVKPPSPELTAAIAQATDMRQAARIAIEEMALIWRPGRGASVLFLLDDVVDPYKVTALIQMMLPDLAGEILPNLPTILPGLLPWIFGPGTSSSALARRSFAQPSTPPTTGLRVLDLPGAQLPRQDVPIGAPTSATPPAHRTFGTWAAALCAVAVAGIAVAAAAGSRS